MHGLLIVHIAYNKKKYLLCHILQNINYLPLIKLSKSQLARLIFIYKKSKISFLTTVYSIYKYLLDSFLVSLCSLNFNMHKDH